MNHQALYIPTPGTSAAASDLHKTILAQGRLLLADLTGPGVIGHIALTHMNHGDDTRFLAMRGVIIRCFWDDEEEASVEVPIGDFFGIGFGEDRRLNSAVWQRDGKYSLHISLPMPFRRRARIELENLNSCDLHGFYWCVEYDRDVPLPDTLEYLHAQYRQSHPVAKVGWHTVLDTVGHGKYVGTVWSVNWMDNRRVPENAFSHFVDGQPVQGTNSEDFFGQSWGFREGTFNQLYVGQGLEFSETDCATTQMSSYRVHLPNPILFQKSFRFVMDCQGYQQGYRCDTYDTVAFWYQNHPHSPFPPLPPVEQLLPIQCARSLWRVMWEIHEAERHGLFKKAVELADSLVHLYPQNSMVPDVLFKKATLQGYCGSVSEARDGYRRLIKEYPQSDAARDAEDRLWLWQQQGRMLLTLVTPSGWTAYLDGVEVVPPATVFDSMPEWGHAVHYRYGRAQALKLATKADAGAAVLKPGDPIPVVSDPFASTVYSETANTIHWHDTSSSAMRLFTLRLEPGLGEHLLAIEARCSNDRPLMLESQMPGGLIAVLHDGCELAIADDSWLVTRQPGHDWQEPTTPDTHWEAATAYANESYGDAAWFWLHPCGFRRFPGALTRIWDKARDGADSTLYLRKRFKVRPPATSIATFCPTAGRD